MTQKLYELSLISYDSSGHTTGHVILGIFSKLGLAMNVVKDREEDFRIRMDDHKQIDLLRKDNLLDMIITKIDGNYVTKPEYEDMFYFVPLTVNFADNTSCSFWISEKILNKAY